MKFELELRNGTWYLTGKTIVGFWLWGKDLEKLASDIIPTVNYLIEHNKLDLPMIRSAPEHVDKRLSIFGLILSAWVLILMGLAMVVLWMN